ncbi:hypothetical protein AGRA3207_007447 [Actinomadura graeca]|uniref:Bacterial transcriptional activator domain-containing protein n=1 Tax=Actinomadura graeca TaxID=2750812 RepID=A0ABX8R7F7_9ACTN|nr:BTAD domain-containing putative transcriptional regulator [Actinomadura graeca]QXJ25882.1 hypothetical protein AGRA3207_007447 [Actinomadura graeca]
MQISMLGESLVIKDDHGRNVLPQTRRRQQRLRGLLCALSFEDWAMTARQLKALVWAHEDYRDLTSALTSLIYDARRLLPPDRLITTSGADGTRRYRIQRRSGDRVDVDQFRTAYELAQQACRTGDLDTAARHYGKALALWHTDQPTPLGDLPEAMSGHREKLLAQRRHASEAYAETRLALGQHTTALAEEISALIRNQPANTRLHHLRILTLHRSGRPAEALLAYREAAQALQQLPGSDLERLRDRIVADDPALAWQQHSQP